MLFRTKYAKKFTELAKQAHEKDKMFKIFGSDKHRYRFNPPATLLEIKIVENKLNIKLPEAYVKFMLEVSNGGAGPYYGLYSLKDVIVHNYHILEHCNSKEYQQAEAFINSSMTTEKYNELIKNMETDDDDVYDYYEGLLTKDALVICTEGCTYDYVLMCSGDLCGEVVAIDWNLSEDYPPYPTHRTFEEWWTNYFLKIINGDVTDRGTFKTVNR